MTLIVNLQNLKQENDILLMIKITQNIVKRMKRIQALDYSDPYILVTGDITVATIGADTKAVTRINDEHIDTVENLDIIVHMQNLIEYSNNYSDASGSLWQFEKDESPTNNNGNSTVATDNPLSFKYKSSILGKAASAAGANRVLKNSCPIKIFKYFLEVIRNAIN